MSEPASPAPEYAMPEPQGWRPVEDDWNLWDYYVTEVDGPPLMEVFHNHRHRELEVSAGGPGYNDQE